MLMEARRFIENSLINFKIITKINLLQSEGRMLTDKLIAAGVSVLRKVYTGVTHEFFGMAAVIPKAKAAQQPASKRLKDDLK